MTGRIAPVMTWTGDEQEERKKLMCVLMAGDTTALYDNISMPLESDVLCAALTQETFSDRQLGKNNADAKLVAPTSCTLMGTGNNIVVRGDLRTRVLRCRIDPNMDHPEERDLDADALMRRIEHHRAAIVYACLVILRAYFVDGYPSIGLKPSRFPQWSDVVRSALVWLDCEDPMLTTKDVEQDDPGLSSSFEALVALEKLLGTGRGMLAGEIKMAADEKLPGSFTYCRNGLRQVLLGVAGDKGEINPRWLGKYLKQLDGTMVADNTKKFVGEMDSHTKQKRWKVVPVAGNSSHAENA